MKLLVDSKIRLVLLGLAVLYLSDRQAVGAPIIYNHPRVFVHGEGTIRPGSIDKINPDGAQSIIISDLDRPSGIALDPNGNLYYGNVTSGSIIVNLFKRAPDGTVMDIGEVVDTSGGTVSISGWGFDVAVSPSGDIFYNHPRVKAEGGGIIRPGSIDKINPDGTRSTVVSGLDRPSGIALDRQGSLYYGNVTSGSIVVNLFKRAPDGTVTDLGKVVDTSGGTVSISGWGFDVAVGPSGDIFYNHPRVKAEGGGIIREGSIDKISPDGTKSTVVSGLDRPSGIALDRHGNLFYGDVTSGSIIVNLYKRAPDGTVTDLGEVVDTSGGSFSISGWGFDVALAIVRADVDIKPDTLNLRSKGKWVTCDIWLPEGYSVADVDPYTVFLEDEIQAEWIWFDEDQQVVMARFRRSEVQEMLGEVETPSDVELVVSGELTDGTVFEGTDVIRVIDRWGKKQVGVPVKIKRGR